MCKVTLKKCACGLTQLNCAKMKYIIITRKKRTYPSLFLYGTQLEHVSKFKFLGVTVDDKLSWTDHVVSTCGRAKRLLGYIYRQFHHCGKPTILHCKNVWITSTHFGYLSCIEQ